MGWAVTFGWKFVRFLTAEFGLVLVGLAITLAIYVALYLFSFRSTGRRSLRGFVQYTFPAEIFSRARIDLFAYFLGKLAWGPMVAKILAFFAVEAAALACLNAFFGKHVLAGNNSPLVLATQFLVFYLTSNFAYYWAHRWMHQNKFLWSVHRTHHSAESMTFLTGGRVHPVESVGVALWTALWVGGGGAVLSYATGLAMHPLFPAAVSLWVVFTDITDKFQHSHLRTSLGPLNYILPLGDMHQIHHSAELKHRDKNFGNASSLFDWMFGTIYIPGPEETIRLGLSEEELGAQNPHKRVVDIYLEPFAYAWRVIRGRRRVPSGGVPALSVAQTSGTAVGS